MRGIQVHRFLWRVVERRQGKRQWYNGTRWKTPTTIVLSRCGQPSLKHTMTVNEVGIRFGRPHRGWPTLFAATYNRRLDASLNRAVRAHADRDWRLLWLQGLYKAADPKDPLGWWTRNRHDDLPSLLTRTSASSMACLTWWNASHTLLEEEEDDPKVLVPRTSTLSLQGFLGSATMGPNRRTRVPAPESTTTTHTTVDHANLYQLFKAATGGQPVELRTLASFLGSSAHLEAMVTALLRKPKLPTALVPRGGGWGRLADYAQRLPAVVREAGRGFIADLLDKVEAVEFPVYWSGLAADDSFVHSRIDAVTRNGGSVDVWEFKTKWSTENKAHLTKPLLRDLRQVVLYAYMLRMQTGLSVSKLHVRYATVDPTGRVTLATHSFAFDPVRFKWAVADALRSTTAYVDRTLATLNVDALAAAVHRPNGWTMPDFQLLRLVGVRPLVDPRASAELPAPRGPWVERLGALWVPKTPTSTVYGDAPGNNSHTQLDRRVKLAGTELSKLLAGRRCHGKLKERLNKLYGPPSMRNERRRRDTAEALIIRTLNRGVNALVGKDAVDAPPGFAHSSDRPRWSPEAIAAGSKHLLTVVDQVRHEIRQMCGR
eukprot:m.256374 g.256374  ORF g.256374 m.256374 type:complete len:600 (+) comp26570_c0_seq15:2688-4487(+)